MRGFLAVVRHTLAEAFHRKLLLAMFALIVAELLLAAALVGSAAGLITLGGMVLQAREGTSALNGLFGVLAVLFYYPGLLLLCWLTAGVFPRLQERGSIDLLLSKPISRLALFGGRWVGCALMALAASTLFFGGNYLVLGWKTGLWVPAFLLTIPASWFTYTALLSMMALVSLLSRSTGLVSLVVTAYAILLGPILFAASTEMGRTLMGESGWASLFGLLYNVLPRTAETGVTLFEAVREGRVKDWEPLLQVGVSAAAWFAAGAYWFRRKDY